MLKVLRVGDPHVRPSNIQESEKLLAFIADQAIKNGVQRIEILGDLMHTHAVIRVEALEFWNDWLDTLADICQTVVLVGNHDMKSNADGDSHALSVFNNNKKHKNLTIVSHTYLDNGIGYIAYKHDKEDFIHTANSLVDQGAKCIVGHTTYEGSRFENGFYAPDGVDPELVNCQLLISGHVHARQRFVTSKSQQVIYPGTARWDTASDANQPKGLWLVEHGDNAEILNEQFIDTSEVCEPIISVSLKEGEELPEFAPNARVSVELVGSSDWISKQKSKLKGKFSLKAKITDKKGPTRRTGSSLEDYIKNVHETSLDKQQIFNFMKEVGIV